MTTDYRQTANPKNFRLDSNYMVNDQQRFSDWRYLLALLAAAATTLWLAGLFFWLGERSFYRQPLYFLSILPVWVLLINSGSIISYFRNKSIYLATAALCLWAIVTLSYAQQQVNWTHLLDSVRHALLILGFVLGMHAIRRYVPNISLLILYTLSFAGLIAASFYISSWVLEAGPAANMIRFDPGLAFATNANQVSSLFAPPLITGMAMLLMCRTLWGKWWGAITGALLLFVMFWTHCRSGILASGAVILGMLAFKRQWWLFAICLFLFVAIIAFMLLGYAGGRDLLELHNIESRLAMYQATLARIAQSPILGEGAWIEWPQTIIRWHHPHNIFLHIWLQGGLIALGLFVMLLIRAFRLSKLILDSGGHTSRLVAFAAAGMLVHFLLQGLVAVREPFTQPDISWLIFWMPIALLGAEAQYLQQDKAD